MEESWSINTVDYYRSFFNQYIIDTNKFDKSSELTSNLCYNFQNLEFLNLILQKHELYNVVRRQTIKSFIIIGSGIIESLLSYFLISREIHPTTEWSIHDQQNSDIFIEGGKKYRTKTTTYIGTESSELSELRFHEIVQLIEHHKLLGNEMNIYLGIYEIKNLRNKVHLNSIKKFRDHDWNNFNPNKYYLLTEILREILKSDLFNCENDFLKEKFQFLMKEISLD